MIAVATFMINQTIDIYQILLGTYAFVVIFLIVWGIYKKVLSAKDSFELFAIISTIFFWPFVLFFTCGYFLLRGLLRLPNNLRYKSLLRKTNELHSYLAISRAKLDEALHGWNQASSAEKVDHIQTELITSLNSIKSTEAKIKANVKILQKITVSVGGVSKEFQDLYKDEFYVLGDLETPQHSTFFNLSYQLIKYSDGQVDLSVKENDLTRHLLDVRTPLYLPVSDHDSKGGSISYRVVERSHEREEWKSIFSNAFKKGIKVIDRSLQARVLGAILEILENPTSVKGDTIKPLTADFKGMWRYRIGDYRLVYLPKLDNRQILFVEFASRSHIYH